MKQLFLTSSVHAVAHDIAKKVNLSGANKLVFIDTAAEPKGEREDLTWLKNDRKSLVDAGFIVSDYSITGKTKNQLEMDLNEFNFIYISGGSTSYLLGQSQKSGFISVVKDLIQKKEKIYIGTSAGSIIAGPKLPYYLNDKDMSLENTDCFNFVNFTIVPHWGSEHFKERYLGERLKTLYKEDQVPLLLLTDHQYVYVQNDQVKIIEVKN